MNIRIRTRASYFIIILNNSSKIYPRTFEKIRTPSLCYCPFLHQDMIENASRIFQPNYFTGSYDETCSVVLATFTNIDFISSVFVFRLGNEAAASPKVFLTLWHHQHLHHPPMPPSMFPGSMP